MRTLTPARFSSAAIRRVASSPIHRGHADVHQHYVGAALTSDGERLGAIFGLTHDLDVRGGIQENTKAGADQRLVVGQQNADHGALSGSRA